VRHDREEPGQVYLRASLLVSFSLPIFVAMGKPFAKIQGHGSEASPPERPKIEIRKSKKTNAKARTPAVHEESAHLRSWPLQNEARGWVSSLSG
jgi:hypothetical protein